MPSVHTFFLPSTSSSHISRIPKTSHLSFLPSYPICLLLPTALVTWADGFYLPRYIYIHTLGKYIPKIEEDSSQRKKQQGEWIFIRSIDLPTTAVYWSLYICVHTCISAPQTFYFITSYFKCQCGRTEYLLMRIRENGMIQYIHRTRLRISCAADLVPSVVSWILRDKIVDISLCKPSASTQLWYDIICQSVIAQGVNLEKKKSMGWSWVTKDREGR